MLIIVNKDVIVAKVLEQNENQTKEHLHLIR